MFALANWPGCSDKRIRQQRREYMHVNTHAGPQWRLSCHEGPHKGGAGVLPSIILSCLSLRVPSQNCRQAAICQKCNMTVMDESGNYFLRDNKGRRVHEPKSSTTGANPLKVPCSKLVWIICSISLVAPDVELERWKALTKVDIQGHWTLAKQSAAQWGDPQKNRQQYPDRGTFKKPIDQNGDIDWI